MDIMHLTCDKRFRKESITDESQLVRSVYNMAGRHTRQLLPHDFFWVQLVSAHPSGESSTQGRSFLAKLTLLAFPGKAHTLLSNPHLPSASDVHQNRRSEQH